MSRILCLAFQWYCLVFCFSNFLFQLFFFSKNNPQGSFVTARDLSKQDNAAIPVSRSIQLLSCFQIHVKLHSIPSKGKTERGENFAYGQVLGRTNNMLSYYISFAWDFPSSRMICYSCVTRRQKVHLWFLIPHVTIIPENISVPGTGDLVSTTYFSSKSKKPPSNFKLNTIGLKKTNYRAAREACDLVISSTCSAK